MKEAAEQVEKRSEDWTWTTITSKLIAATVVEESYLNLQIANVSDGAREKSPGRPDVTVSNH